MIRVIAKVFNSVDDQLVASASSHTSACPVATLFRNLSLPAIVTVSEHVHHECFISMRNKVLLALHLFGAFPPREESTLICSEKHSER